MLNLLHGFFGIGAILAPLAVAVFGPGHYPAYFTGFALLTLVTALGVQGVRSFPTQGSVAPETAASASATGLSMSAGKRLYFMVGFLGMIAVFVFHVAVGSGIGSWEATYLTLSSISVEQAAAATSLFWFSMTASRFVLAAAIRRLHPGTVVTLSCTLMMTGSVLAFIPGFAVAGLALAGFAIGPIFPTALAWANQLFGGRSWISGSLIAISMLGGIAFPPLLGATVTAGSEQVLFPLALAGLSLLCVLACLAIGSMRIIQNLAGFPHPRHGPHPCQSHLTPSLDILLSLVIIEYAQLCRKSLGSRHDRAGQAGARTCGSGRMPCSEGAARARQHGPRPRVSQFR
jgi:FHS family glucose/mannose:H+ symporter-like MFS transporter